MNPSETLAANADKKKSLTVLHITSSKNSSGGTRQAFALSNGLRQEGHRVVFCASAEAQALRWAKKAGMEIYPVEFGNIFGQWRSSRRLREIVKKVGADVVHAHHTKGHNVALLATFFGKFPPVIVNRGVLFKPVFPWKFKTSRIAAIIVNSSSVKSVLGRSGSNHDKIYTIYNAPRHLQFDIPPEKENRLREELSIPAGAPVVGAVGSGREEKGFAYLVEAAPLILKEHPGSLFVLVGAKTKKFIPRIKELGMEKSFRLTGHRSDAVDVMHLFSLIVLPSIDMDSCPNVLLEAMGVGIPAVGSDVGGIGEIIANKQTGIVVPPKSPEAIAGAVCGILSAEDKGASMGNAARNKLQNEFSLERKTLKTIEVYKSVL